MPEYLAPGVYVEETASRERSIEAVPTSTAAFIGPTRYGPYRVDGGTPERPELLTSTADFERIYGGLADLELGAEAPGTNHLAHAVRAFFNEGGSSLYVARASVATPTDLQKAPWGSVVRLRPTRGAPVLLVRQDSGWREEGEASSAPVDDPTQLRIEGLCEGNPSIRVGATVALRGVSARFDQRCHVSSAIHRYDNAESYRTSFAGACPFPGDPE